MDAAEANWFASYVVRSLCGNRWTWPLLRVTDRYPINTSRTVRLVGQPVVEVFSVVDALGAEVIDWRGSQRIHLPRSLPACGDQTWVDVDYSFGSQPPLVAQEAVAVLAAELQVDSSSAECRIPERVTTIVRQGVAYTLIDPQDFLQDGRTGIYEVDLAIKTLNPGRARLRARLFTPEFPPADRLASEVIDA